MMNDPQFGVARLLRPFAGFETAYQDKLASIPIMFTEGGEPLDVQAGQTGYATNLLKGLSVAMGQRITVFLPRITGLSGEELPQSVYPYRWEFTWRFRNLFDSQQQRVAWHLAKQGAGVPAGANARVVLPAAVQTVVYPESPEPVFTTTEIVNANLRTERTRTELGTWSRPFIDDAGVTTGAYQQGLFDPAISSLLAEAPLFGSVDLHALGDELLIGVTRSGTPLAGGSGGAENNWEFGSGETDQNLSRLFGTGFGTTFPDIAIYVFGGIAP